MLVTSVHALGKRRPSRMKPKGLGIFVDFPHLKSCCLQAITKSVGNDRHEGVAQRIAVMGNLGWWLFVVAAVMFSMSG